MLRRITRMSASHRLLFGWICLIAGFVSLSFGFVGAWPFTIFLLAYFVLRYVMKPRLPSRWPLWFTCGYVLLVLAVVIIPAWREWPPSFTGIFRTFQWVSASFMLFYALTEHVHLL